MVCSFPIGFAVDDNQNESVIFHCLTFKRVDGAASSVKHRLQIMFTVTGENMSQSYRLAYYSLFSVQNAPQLKPCQNWMLLSVYRWGRHCDATKIRVDEAILSVSLVASIWTTRIECIDAIEADDMLRGRCTLAHMTPHRKIMTGAKFVHRADYGLTIITSKTHKYKSFGRCLIVSMLFIGLLLTICSVASSFVRWTSVVRLTISPGRNNILMLITCWPICSRVILSS